jgi:hypothetical protein
MRSVLTLIYGSDQAGFMHNLALRPGGKVQAIIKKRWHRYTLACPDGPPISSTFQSV